MQKAGFVMLWLNYGRYLLNDYQKDFFWHFSIFIYSRCRYSLQAHRAAWAASNGYTEEEIRCVFDDN